ncbi:hypothetical protein D3C72_1974750 [compost metagenome]
MHAEVVRFERFDQAGQCGTQLVKSLGAVDGIVHDGVGWEIEHGDAGASLRGNQ